jgi:hypothetical protein
MKTTASVSKGALEKQTYVCTYAIERGLGDSVFHCCDYFLACVAHERIKAVTKQIPLPNTARSAVTGYWAKHLIHNHDSGMSER